jgi:hypothetical protein
MTTKADYTPQEWETLLKAPLLTGTYIMISDVSITAMGKEFAGMVKALQAQEAPAEAQDLVAAVAADLMARAERKEKMEEPQIDKNQDPRPQVLAQIQEALAVLDAKSSPAEKAGFTTWLLNVAQATAEAGREGGFLGIGSVRVSEQEEAALEELKQAFGLA